MQRVWRSSLPFSQQETHRTGQKSTICVRPIGELRSQGKALPPELKRQVNKENHHERKLPTEQLVGTLRVSAGERIKTPGCLSLSEVLLLGASVASQGSIMEEKSPPGSSGGKGK